MSAQKPIYHGGQEVSLTHLGPRIIRCPCEPIKRDLLIRVSFANHCYTEAFSASRHTTVEIVLYDSPSRPRVFCPLRHSLSFKLPGLLDGLPSMSVHQTPEKRNYVYMSPNVIEGRPYEIYFMLQRAQSRDDVDLKLTVESAYLADSTKSLPKRPNSIRFKILACKIFSKRPVKFAPR
jgi:hypothetical protein